LNALYASTAFVYKYVILFVALSALAF
jgi:hypothetical protein